MKQVMVDCETLGTTADAVILSIGAVKFDLAKGEVSDDGFYASVSIESNLEAGRRISEDTLLWWLKQPAAAQQVFHEPKETLGSTLEQLSDWIATDDCEVWSNGADFDVPMLAHAFTQHSILVPWRYYNARCFRTYKNLPGAKDVKVPAPQGVKHNALADAHNQAAHACAIYKHLFAIRATAGKVKAKA